MTMTTTAPPCPRCQAPERARPKPAPRPTRLTLLCGHCGGKFKSDTIDSSVCPPCKSAGARDDIGAVSGS